MNDVIRQLYERKSTRVFEEREIPEDVTQQILTAACMAPTAGNQQLYTVLRITDEALKNQLSESCDHQPFIAQGKLVLIFCADCRKWYRAFKENGCDPRLPGEGDLLLAVSDANIAAQNAVVAAHALGVGSCYIGDIMENIEIHRDMLHLPQYVFPCAMLVMGYPTPQQLERTKPRRAPLECIVLENVYRDLEGDALRDALYKGDVPADYKRWLHAFCERKYNSSFAREMTRSVRQYLLDFAKTTEES
ncbi:MAG: nitroreductase [Clostridiales bacterium]|nr:nitroreductase [Clostridiales bacterium]